MKIGYFDAVCAAGENIDEIFELILNKKASLGADFENGEGALYTGRIEAFGFGAMVERMLDRYPNKQNGTLITIRTPKSAGFDGYEEASTFAQALSKAEKIVQEGKRALIFASYSADDETIKSYVDNHLYSSAVARPFDIDADGLNLSDGAAIIEICDDGAYDISEFDPSQSEKIEYILSCANGIKSEDEKLCKELAVLFGQSAYVGSPIGAIGYMEQATDALALAVLLCSMKEEIMLASSMLEHGFTNELNFTYANRVKKLKNTLFATTAGEYYDVRLRAR